MNLLALILTISLHAKALVTVAVQEHKNYSAKDGKGYINDLIRTYKKAGIKAKFVYLPLKRATDDYNVHKKFDCMIGGDEELLKFHGHKTSDKYFSLPHLVFKTRVLSKTKKICDLKELEGKSLIVVNHFPYKKVLKDIKLSRVEVAPNLDQAIKMAEHDRAEAFIGYTPTPNIGVQKFQYCPDLELTKNLSKTHCYKSKQTSEFILGINKALKELKKSGEMERLLKNSYGKRVAVEQMKEL